MSEIKLKMYQVRSMKDPLTKLIEKEIKVSLAFRITKLIKVIDQYLEDIEELRISLVNKLGVKNEETNTIEVPGKKMKQFSQSMNELLNEEVTIDFTPIPIAELGDDLELATKDLMILEPLFV